MTSPPRITCTGWPLRRYASLGRTVIPLLPRTRRASGALIGLMRLMPIFQNTKNSKPAKGNKNFRYPLGLLRARAPQSGPERLYRLTSGAAFTYWWP